MLILGVGDLEVGQQRMARIGSTTIIYWRIVEKVHSAVSIMDGGQCTHQEDGKGKYAIIDQNRETS